MLKRLSGVNPLHMMVELSQALNLPFQPCSPSNTHCLPLKSPILVLWIALNLGISDSLN